MDCVIVAQSCPPLCDAMDCSPPGSSLHGILQARILECVAIFFSKKEYVSIIKNKMRQKYVKRQLINPILSLDTFSAVIHNIQYD